MCFESKLFIIKALKKCVLAPPRGQVEFHSEKMLWVSLQPSALNYQHHWEFVGESHPMTLVDF